MRNKNVKDDKHNVIRESQVKTTRKSVTQLLEWLNSKKLTPPIAIEDSEATGTLISCSENIEWCGHFRHQFGNFFHKAEQSYHMIQQNCSVIYPNELKMYVHKQKLGQDCL